MLNKWVLKVFFKVPRVFASWTEGGSEFQAERLATRKERSPIQVRVLGIDNSRVLEDLSRFRPESFARRLMWSRRYCGARLWGHLKTRRQSLNWIRRLIPRMWSTSRRTGVMWSCFPTPLMSLAAALPTACSRAISRCGSPTNIALQ